MSKFVVRIAVVTAVVLLSGTLYAVSSTSPSSTLADAPVTDVPAAQVVVPATTLTPVPPPAPTPTRAAAPRKRGAGHKSHLRRGHHRHHRAGHRATRPRRAHPARRVGGGQDIGWPQCPHDIGFRGRNGLGQPMPASGVRFVVVGLTNGRAFTPNPCLARHLRWVRNHHVYASAYAFATYPTRRQVHRYRHRGPYDGHGFLGALRNAGHSAARYNIRVMQRHGFATPHVWLDVEPSSSRPWSRRHRWNGAVVKGWVRAYRDAGYTVGFYSTTNLWHAIVGPLRLRLPEWRTAGPVSARAALRKCYEPSFQGGPAVIAQWWTNHRDFDRLCPSVSRDATLERYFHKW